MTTAFVLYVSNTRIFIKHIGNRLIIQIAGLADGEAEEACGPRITDLNLHEAIMRTTKIHVADKPIALSFADSEIYEYPVLYLTEPGYWVTNEEEVQNMQKYFARSH